jgi:DNA-binding CsgD family transcriptional regulator
LAHRCGATRLEAGVREELTAAGARPRRPAISGIESLTPTETRLAQLAAQGLSNRDIAEMIFVSRNTVAWHLRKVYRKLAIDSREQLALLVE